MNLWVIFITGLTVGGLSCLAVQGGLLASTIAAREEDDQKKAKLGKHNFFPVTVFLASKLIAYIILGFLLGAFGQALALSDEVQITMQLVAGLYMIAIALNLLNVHPIFRYAVIQPPKFLTRLVRNQSKSKDLFAPSFLGLMTIFIPCGTTLAMEALAISSGSAIMGAAIMGAFVLGTVPLFFGLGFLTTALGDTFKTRFYKFAGFAVLYLGITSINGSLVAAGSPLTLQSIAENSPVQINLNQDEQLATVKGMKLGQTQSLDIKVLPNGYSPNYFKVQSGVPLQLNLTTSGKLTCASAFRIPKLGISKRLAANTTESIVIPPQSPGKIPFTCSMGMYTGVIEVI